MISAVQTQRGNDHRELGVFAKTRWKHVTQSPVKTWSVTHLMTDFPPPGHGIKWISAGTRSETPAFRFSAGEVNVQIIPMQTCSLISCFKLIVCGPEH